MEYCSKGLKEEPRELKKKQTGHSFISLDKMITYKFIFTVTNWSKGILG